MSGLLSWAGWILWVRLAFVRRLACWGRSDSPSFLALPFRRQLLVELPFQHWYGRWLRSGQYLNLADLCSQPYVLVLNLVSENVKVESNNASGKNRMQFGWWNRVSFLVISTEWDEVTLVEETACTLNPLRACRVTIEGKFFSCFWAGTISVRYDNGISARTILVFRVSGMRGRAVADGVFRS